MNLAFDGLVADSQWSWHLQTVGPFSADNCRKPMPDSVIAVAGPVEKRHSDESMAPDWHLGPFSMKSVRAQAIHRDCYIQSRSGPNNAKPCERAYTHSSGGGQSQPVSRRWLAPAAVVVKSGVA
jgi:hypothetical protein